MQGAALLVLLLASGRAFGAEPSRVAIVRPEAPGPLLQEALIRTRGELRAVGFAIDEHTPSDAALTPDDPGPDVYGSLAFEEIGAIVRISATSADGGAPLVQSVDTRAPGVDAEVVAVRAVETLRAAMLRFTRQADSARRALPSPVRGFTQTEAPPAPPPAPKPLPEPPRAVPEPARAEPSSLMVWLGPSLLLPTDSAGLGWGAQAGLYFGRAWYFAGVSLETAIAPTRYSTDSGSAEVRRTLALLSVRTLIDVEDSSVLSASTGFGFASYSVQGRADPGFDANQANHESGAFALELGGAHWLLDHVGSYLTLRASLALDAAVIRIDEREIGTLDRPALSLSVGVVVGRR